MMKVGSELFPYIVLVQDKVLFTSKVSASSSPLLFRGWWVRPVGQVVQVIPATQYTHHIMATNQKYEWGKFDLENISDQSGEFGQSTL